MSEILQKLSQASIRRLNGMLQNVLLDAANGEVPNFDGTISIVHNRDDVLFAFVENMNQYFEALTGPVTPKPEAEYNFETLSLVQDDDLDLMVAVDGMVGSARNAHLPTFISFNTRLNSLISDVRVDESLNPLDPAQVANAFKDAIAPLGLTTANNLALFRHFNSEILRNLEEVLTEANHLLIENGVIPNLGMDSGKKSPPAGRSAPRPDSTERKGTQTGFDTIEEEPYHQHQNNPEMFSMMQNLMHGNAGGTGPAPAPQNQAPTPAEGDPQYAIPQSMMPQSGVMQPFTPAPGEQVQMVDQAQLMSILTNIQKSLDDRSLERSTKAKGEETDQGEDDDSAQLDISETLGEMLKEGQEEGTVQAVDRQSSDIINLVTMLYEAIWRDESVPIPIKELIGRTQITIIKVALSDTTFFNDENHPARMVLNDFAEAGIGWTEVDDLEEDPLYQKIQELVNKVLTEYEGDIAFFEAIVKDFRGFRAREAAKTRVLEQRILRAKERKERLEDIHELVTQKIAERVLGRELDPFVKETLDEPFHKFMVMLVLKEGPGTNAWKQAINTIDVLLWTVQPHEHEGDRDRLETVNPRLLNNLRKAFRIAQVSADDVDQLITQLKEVQEASFISSAPKAQPIDDPLDLKRDTTDESVASEKGESEQQDDDADEEEFEDDDAHVQQVDALHVGIWVEFSGDDDVAVRCKLAAKISAIDKYIFVNRQGVKVVEKTRMGLVREVKDGTVKIISDGLLFSRALESVIGNLREKQQEQQTGGAYQPGREESTA